MPSDSAASPENPQVPLRPDLPPRETTATIVPESQLAGENGDSASTPDEKPKAKREAEGTLGQESRSPLKRKDTSASVTPVAHSIHWSDLIFATLIFIMLSWPWIFFGVVWARGGIQASNHFAKVVKDHPQATNFFVTQIGSIVNYIVAFLFSMAILRFAQGWMAPKESVTVFHLSFISALRHHTFPWGLGDREYLLARNRWLRVVLVGVCIYAFTNVTSGVTSLINPLPINQKARLEGKELDFSSTAPDCLAWLNANPIDNSCDWKTFNGANYTNCLGENQLVDVLESGRGNILSLISNNSETQGFGQLGAKDGLQFLGPIRGVLPIGPNGVPAFDTLGPSPFTNARINARMISYNYSLGLQGVNSDISCKYDTQTPVKVYPVIGDSTGTVLQFNGTCNGLADVLKDVVTYTSMNSNNSLTFWACKSLPSAQQPSYYIYLRGRANYATSIGNITCVISPIQPAIFPVSYESTRAIFSSTKPNVTFATTFDGYIEQSVVALGGLIAEGQNQQANLVAESVITFGVKSFQLPPYQQSEQYLRLYEAMIQGILEYEATYTRLLFSTTSGRPSSCTREVTGSVDYTVLGWSAERQHIGFLMPMTLVNLTSLILFLIAITRAKRGRLVHDPTDPKILALADRAVEVGKPTAMGDRVTFPPKETIKDDVPESEKGDNAV